MNIISVYIPNISNKVTIMNKEIIDGIWTRSQVRSKASDFQHLRQGKSLSLSDTSNTQILLLLSESESNPTIEDSNSSESVKFIYYNNYYSFDSIKQMLQDTCLDNKVTIIKQRTIRNVTFLMLSYTYNHVSHNSMVSNPRKDQEINKRP